jgi:DNA-binding transcriptional ArsR family regulator
MSVSAHLKFDALNAALKAAGEETRLRILVLLGEAELTVSDLTQILRQSQPRISRHLKLLAEAGLVDCEFPAAARSLPQISWVDARGESGQIQRWLAH